MATRTKTPATNGTAATAAVELAADERARLAVAEMISAITQEIAGADTENALLLMAGRILEADRPEDLTVGGKADHARDHLDTPILVESITWTGSDYQEGYPFYALFHGRELRTGTARVISCGGATVVPAAWMLASKGWLPAVVVFSEGKANPETGYKPINLIVTEDQPL